MSDYLELKGCRALVTGGTKGIGEAVAVQLREAGAKVLSTARTRPDDLGPQDLFVAADITTPQGCAAVADTVMEQLGGIDIVIHVVGGSSAPPGGFAVLNDDEWQRALEGEVPLLGVGHVQVGVGDGQAHLRGRGPGSARHVRPESIAPRVPEGAGGPVENCRSAPQ